MKRGGCSSGSRGCDRGLGGGVWTMRNENRGIPTGYFAISVAARMLGVHAQTLRAYERQGLLTPSRTKGRIRLYSIDDIRRAQQIRRLIEDLGVNLAGVEVILQ